MAQFVHELEDIFRAIHAGVSGETCKHCTSKNVDSVDIHYVMSKCSEKNEEDPRTN